LFSKLACYSRIISNIKAVALAQIFLGTDNKIRNDFTWLLKSESGFQRQIKPLEKPLSKEIILRAKKDIESADVILFSPSCNK
jgi:hypothetical protein